MCSNINYFVWNTVVPLLVLLVGVYSCSGQVSRDQLFPFGSSNGDSTLKREWTGSNAGRINLLTPFTFFNKTHSTLYVNILGNIYLRPTVFYTHYLPYECDSKRLSSYGPMIAPLWSAIQYGDHVHYRETTNANVISKARDEVKRGFPDVGHISFKSVVVATWDNVSHYRDIMCPDGKQRNTFQAVLASDGKKSFVIFYYNELTWTHPAYGENSYCEPHNVFRAVAGFTPSVEHPFQFILRDCQSDVLKLTEMSNVGEMGKWIFRVDGKIASPTIREYNDCAQPVSSERILSSFGVHIYAMLVFLCLYVWCSC